MKIQANREDLLGPMQRVINVIERKQTMAILANVLLYTEDHTLRLLGTDLEVEIDTRTSITVSEPLCTSLPARKWLDILRALPDGAMVSMNFDDQHVELRSGKSRFRLGLLPGENFPRMKMEGSPDHFELPREDMQRMIRMTGFAISNQADARHYTNGLFFQATGKQVTAVATDGHRMAIYEKTLANVLPDTPGVIIPRKAIIEFGRLLQQAEQEDADTIALVLSDREMRCFCSDTVLSSRLIEGKYPDYRQVIPLGLNAEARMDRLQLRDVLSRMAVLLAQDEGHGARFRFSDQGLSLKTTSQDRDEADDAMELDYQGDVVETGFNILYLRDILNALDCEQVRCHLNDIKPDQAIIIEGIGVEGIRYILMPMWI